MRTLMIFAETYDLGGADDHRQGRNALLALITVEEADDGSDIQQVAARISTAASGAERNREVQEVVLIPFAHLSPFATDDRSSIVARLGRLRQLLVELGHRATLCSPGVSQKLRLLHATLIDSAATSRLSTSGNGLRHEMRALTRVFSKEVLSNALRDA